MVAGTPEGCKVNDRIARRVIPQVIPLATWLLSQSAFCLSHSERQKGLLFLFVDLRESCSWRRAGSAAAVC